MATNLDRVQCSRGIQIWFLSVLQKVLFWRCWTWECSKIQDFDLSCWFFYLWGDCWYCTVSNGGCYSQSPDSNPSFAKGFSEGLPKILRTEGLSRYVFVFFLSFFFIFWPNINKLRKLGVCTLVLFSCVSWDSNMSSQQWHKHPTLGTQWQQINILKYILIFSSTFFSYYFIYLLFYYYYFLKDLSFKPPNIL